jgi:hypothetical protein
VAVLWPLILYGLLLPSLSAWKHLGIFTIPAALAMSAGIMGGVPYAVFAVLGLAYLWRREPSAYYQWAWRAPIVFTPFLAVHFYLSESMGRTTGSWRDVLGCLAIAGGFSAIVGYTYVLVFLLLSRRFFGSPPPQPAVPRAA